MHPLSPKLLLISCSLLVASAAGANTRQYTLLQGLKKKQVSMTAICSNGGYMGKCLSLALRNNTRQQLELAVDPALIFTPSDPRYQHLVAVGEEQVTLKPGEERWVTLQTFCGKAPAGAPAANVRYSLWKQGDPVMIQTSRYIKEHRLFSSMGQHAIWMFTDRHKLNSVYSPYMKDHEEGKAFVTFLAGITQQEIPQFYTFHQINEQHTGRPVYDRTVSKVYVDMDWTGERRRHLHVLVLDAGRKLYRKIESGEVINSQGLHTVRVTLDPAKDPAGIYYVLLKDDESKVWLEKKAVL
jgi:hypothetical protein